MEKPDLGQVFTKRNVADFMAGLFTLPRFARILDPCFGSGVFLDSLGAQGFTKLVGIELDPKLFRLRTVNAQDGTEFAGTAHEAVGRKNQMAALSACEGCAYVCGDFLKYEDKTGFDGIIMNPPYIRQEKIDSLSDFGIQKEALRQQQVFKELPSTANIYMYFVLKAISLLKKHGEMVLIFPGTWKWAAGGQSFFEAMEKACTITEWFNVRGNPFETGAIVDVVILKLVKGQARPYGSAKTVVFEDGKPPMILDRKAGELSGDAVRSAFETDMVPFLQFADVRRGMTTLNNKMYINPQKLEPKLPKEFLTPIITSPKNIEGYTTKDCKKDALLLTDRDELPIADSDGFRISSRSDLSDRTARRLAAYYEALLASWQDKIMESGQPKTLYERIVRGDKKWYRLKTVSGRGILFGYIVRREMKFISSDTDDAVRDNFYVITPKIDKDMLFGLLNNYYTFYQLEKQGKHYGAGVLKLQKYDIEQLRLVDYTKMDEASVAEFLSYVNLLKETGDPAVVEDITRRLSLWAPVDFDTIKQMYEEAKRKRLEVNV